jgi:hypothetical protein
MTSKQTIDSFLSCRRIALLGVSPFFRRLGGRLQS